MYHEVIYLQPGLSSATLTAFISNTLVENRLSKPAVMICPGGAYLGITEKEAEPVAMQFVAAGYPTFVLNYSIGEQARYPAPMIDVARAVLMLRTNSVVWSIDPNKIFLCGFSTGGQVVATYAATWQRDDYAKALNIDNQLLKPYALILGYPILDLFQFKIKNITKSLEMATLLEMMFTCIYGTKVPSEEVMNEWNVMSFITSHFPPTFLWTTAEDAIVSIEESLDFVKLLAAKQVPYEFHVFEKGAHGISLGDRTVGYTEDEIKHLANTKKWMELALCWMSKHCG